MADPFLLAATALVALALGLGLARFLRGPRALDRVVAFDGLTIVSVAAIALAGLVTGRAIYLDVALVYALLSFLGVIVAARYLEGGEQ
ncbi:monovalent cation/H+ antiporter complex subunit F [Maritimibacter sp. HL-12]|jgi:multicomponent Na+:H+ antiporter subunit F|uniref:monovalent cation/H+ antiporter complex subunit F n=1 Tax=Maritimibacter sp. HL-12 TaxID=1162418 RepID=UPI000A0EED94|nr:monovalent cation/H+ antiporter complex subunit F [Maritimibacter sp. HL-12]SMH52506.1 Membrane bound protein complex subunit mbxB [Maritimibacter sp. HL-12]